MYLQGPAEHDCLTLLCKYLHLQYNVFRIYDELKAVPQRLSHVIRWPKYKQQTDGGTRHAEA